MSRELTYAEAIREATDLAMARDPRVKLIEQPRREGKTSAINLFLAEAQSDICVLESGDTIPHEYAVEHLVRMFDDPTVGMVGAQKMAVNTPEHIVGLLSHLRLRMEHELCLEIPRLGEMIAFRKLFDRIPPDVAMDEAFVEALVVQRGMSVRYAPDAIVYNTGPDNIPDFIRQRRRNHAGHLYLKHKYGYAVSSIQNTRVLRIALKEVLGVISLTRMDRGQSQLGYWVAPGFWNTGLASEAVRALIAANPLNNVALFAEVFQDNAASARVLTNAGFAYIGDAEAHSIARGANVPTWTYIRKMG